MLTCVICEDNEIHRNKINDYLKSVLSELHTAYEIIEFECGEQLLNAYPNHVDIIFLDIKMKELSGMETAQKIRTFDTETEIIFITGLTEFMQQGYEVSARRYLTKPIQYEIFTQQVKPCIEAIIKRKEQYIWVKSLQATYKVRVDNILYAETYGRQVNVYTTQQIYPTYMSLSLIEKALKGEHFFRCQKSCLINLNYVEGITKDSVFIKDKEIPVSRLKMQTLKKELAKIIGE
ncbi:LytR/AlgR family response regulator transcription factor [Cellulosilyticum sp. I15G10I2]|uniref:LytR/AlgR family response regulator transcription factor n=1 Tax=Cellulosilyticum sp. I15G10I2 TaxID=1892843 RepID=UPI00085CDC20|nr:LytTR family DNA-binding domain-containing protein [Cellulosilyticum sp. I15G10I2]